MNTEALLMLAEIIDQPKELFMGDWGYKAKSDDYMNYCGYTACAIGHALLHPWFNERGFVCDHTAVLILSPSYKFKYYGWPAVAEFFQISELDAHHLFDPSYYSENYDGTTITGSVVAKRIRKYIDTQDRRV